MPHMVSQEEVLAIVRGFNSNPDVHGILVQLPLPKHIDEQVGIRLTFTGIQFVNVSQPRLTIIKLSVLQWHFVKGDS